MTYHFTEADLSQMRAKGITEEEVRRQLEIFRKASWFMDLNRRCTVGDGIHRIASQEKYTGVHEQAVLGGRFLKFVPASGAATRMFKVLFQVMQESGETVDGLRLKADQGDEDAAHFIRFWDSLEQFAFFDKLKDAMAADSLDLKALREDGRFQPVLEYLLTEKGLNYGSLPKGLLQFHQYSWGSRTAFEEHLVEAAHYVRDADGVCRLHLTVSPEHEDDFQDWFEKVKAAYETKFNVSYQVDFSVQKPSTDTIAADLDNQPFRDEDGRLLFRAGGHGALLENLNELQGDLIYIKNIDNVVPDRLKEATYLWKKILGGLAVETQQVIHGYLKSLEGNASAELVREITDFMHERLFAPLPEGFESYSLEDQRSFLREWLNRPIRVCGVVQNVGEPGGAPFWVNEKSGPPSIQLVEKAQVDFDSPDQRDIWMSSTHFSPVDLVCAVRDYRGGVFDLREYRDPEAVFISKKSKEGRELKALEHPGLWNGAMAHWISLFVEVPIITFNPVKTVNDLLREQHQP